MYKHGLISMCKIPSSLQPPKLIIHVSFHQIQCSLAAFINWAVISATTISPALLIVCLLLHPLSSGEWKNRAAGKQSPGHLVLQRDAAGAALGDFFPRRQVGEREIAVREASPTDIVYPSKTLRWSEILQTIRKTIRSGNSANGS